jgi:hypothetical protein
MTYIRTDVPHTAAELFDGELVVANYDSGLYYSVAPGGALVWQGLRHGLTPDALVEWLAAAFPNEPDLDLRIRAFIDRIVEDGLAVPADMPEQGGPLPELVGTFGALEIERFEDLQELLLLDPVHDVDTTGWPHRAEDDTSQ